MSSYRDRFYSLDGSKRKKSLFGSLRLVFVVLVGIGLAIVFAMPRLDLGGVMSSAFSKKNHGVILNFFEMSDTRIVEVLGEPHKTTPHSDNDQLYYWRFDPVTVEFHIHDGEIARIAYATSKGIIRDHIEERSLKIYGIEEDWYQGLRDIDGEAKLVYENKQSRRTIVKYEESVMVYPYLFPEA